MKRRNVVLFVLLLVIGFAAVSAVLIINGSTNVAFDENDFTSNVVFTKAETNDGTAEITTGEKNISFETKKLETVNDTAVLTYDVTNKSRQYDASVTINCGLKDSFTSFSDYLDITNDLTSPFDLEAGATKTGNLTIKLTTAYADGEAAPELICTLVASPVERESIVEDLKNKFNSSYVDVNLKGTDPVLDGNKLIPVNLLSSGEAVIVDENELWYDYETKKWANAVILVDKPSKIYSVNDTIDENDIESYFVWIPRFRYKIFDKGNYYYDSNDLNVKSRVKTIEIEFENKDTPPSTGGEVGDWLTHPAFTNYNTNGIWVGKFETGYKGATSKSDAEVDKKEPQSVIVKANCYSWRNITVSNIFKTAIEYEPSLNSHMMRNTEWGAVAYLSHSKYGINTEVRINNNANYLTGYAGNQKDAYGSTTNNSQYNTSTGYLASTTGNITGVYDMSGGAAEYVAGYRANTPGKSGFTTEELTQYANYFDVYSSTSSSDNSYKRILGDATGEMGPFYNYGLRVSSWYYDEGGNFVDSSYPWFRRDRQYEMEVTTGQFAFSSSSGAASNISSFRITLASDKMDTP